MAISKRLRFEIFKRDGFKCRYCGATVLTAILHCDHVVPESKGGPTEAANLVTACVDCNLGKSNVPLDERNVSPSIDIESAKEHAEQIKAYLKVQKTIASSKRELETLALQHWETRMGDWHYSLPRYLNHPIKEFGLDRVSEAIDIVAAKGLSNTLSQVRYFCGVIRNWRNPKPKTEGRARPDTASEDVTAAVQRAQWRLFEDLFNSYWSYRNYETPPSKPIAEILKRANSARLSWESLFLAIDLTEEKYADGAEDRLALKVDEFIADGEPDIDLYVQSYAAAEAEFKDRALSMLWSVWGRFVTPHPKTHADCAREFPLVAAWFSDLYECMGHGEAAIGLLLDAGSLLAGKTDKEQQRVLRDVTRGDRWMSDNAGLLSKWDAE